MKKLCGLRSRAMAISLSLLYGGTHGAFVYSAETQFWVERRRHLEKSQTHSRAILASSLQGMMASRSNLPFVTAIPSGFPPLARTSWDNLPPGFLKDNPGVLAALSSAHGTLRRVDPPTVNNSGSTVIFIQDVHQNREAQKNIAATIQSLLREKNIGLYALEGDFRPFDFSRLRTYGDKDALKIVADFNLAQNKISGPIHAALTSPEEIAPFVGIDDPHHYNANVEAYRTSAPRQKVMAGLLSQIRAELVKGKNNFNPSLKALDNLVEAYRNNWANFGDLVMALNKYVPFCEKSSLKKFLTVLELEKNLDFKQVERERFKLIEELFDNFDSAELQALMAQSIAHRRGQACSSGFFQNLKAKCGAKGVKLESFPALETYIRYVLISDSINVEDLFDEIVSTEKEAFARAIENREEKRLVEESLDLYLVEKLTHFTLSPLEWEEYKTRRTLFAPPLLSIDLSSFESFYHEAELRNEKMVHNLLTEMAKAKTKSAVLVAGGFHGFGITGLLQARGLAVLSFVPEIDLTEASGESSYLRVFSQQKTPLQRLYRGENLFLALPPMEEETENNIGIQIVAVKPGKNPLDTVRKVTRQDFSRRIKSAIVRVSNDGITTVQLLINGVGTLTTYFNSKTRFFQQNLVISRSAFVIVSLIALIVFHPYFQFVVDGRIPITIVTVVGVLFYSSQKYFNRPSGGEGNSRFRDIALGFVLALGGWFLASPVGVCLHEYTHGFVAQLLGAEGFTVTMVNSWQSDLLVDLKTRLFLFFFSSGRTTLGDYTESYFVTFWGKFLFKTLPYLVLFSLGTFLWHLVKVLRNSERKLKRMTGVFIMGGMLQLYTSSYLGGGFDLHIQSIWGHEAKTFYTPFRAIGIDPWLPIAIHHVLAVVFLALLPIGARSLGDKWRIGKENRVSIAKEDALRISRLERDGILKLYPELIGDQINIALGWEVQDKVSELIGKVNASLSSRIYRKAFNKEYQTQSDSSLPKDVVSILQRLSCNRDGNSNSLIQTKNPPRRHHLDMTFLGEHEIDFAELKNLVDTQVKVNRLASENGRRAYLAFVVPNRHLVPVQTYLRKLSLREADANSFVVLPLMADRHLTLTASQPNMNTRPNEFVGNFRGFLKKINLTETDLSYTVNIEEDDFFDPILAGLIRSFGEESPVSEALRFPIRRLLSDVDKTLQLALKLATHA